MHKENLDFVNGKLAAQTLSSETLAACSTPCSPRPRTAVKCWTEPTHFNSLFFWKKRGGNWKWFQVGDLYAELKKNGEELAFSFPYFLYGNLRRSDFPLVFDCVDLSSRPGIKALQHSFREPARWAVDFFYFAVEERFQKCLTIRSRSLNTKDSSSRPSWVKRVVSPKTKQTPECSWGRS